MPQKMNRSQMQNYIPKGNGDPSGEYADDEGGNIHIQFKTFKKPSKQDIDLKPSKETKPKDQPKEEPKVKSTKEKKYQAYFRGFGWEDIGKERYDKYKEAFGTKYVREIEASEISEEDQSKIVDYEKKKILDLSKNTSNIRDIYNWANKTDDDLENILKKNGFNKQDIDRIHLQSKIFGDKEITSKMYHASLDSAKQFIESKLPKFKEKQSLEQIATNCNPKFKEGGDYTINCQRCPLVFELRMRGYDVQAKANDNHFEKYGNWLQQMDFKERYMFNNNRLPKEQIEQKIIEAGNGARFAVSIHWKGSRDGHLFTAINDNGKVRFIDTQDGNMNCESYFRKIAPTKQTQIYRMDNANFMAGVCETTTIGA